MCAYLLAFLIHAFPLQVYVDLAYYIDLATVHKLIEVGIYILLGVFNVIPM